MKKINTLSLAICFCLFTMAQQEELCLKLEKGKVYKQVTESKAAVSQDINGQKMDMVMIIRGSMSYLVKDVNDAGYDMEVTYESLSMSMQLAQVTMEFSSEKNDENDILSSILSLMKDKPFQIKMTRLGKISEVKDIESLWEHALSKFSSLSEAQISQIKAQINKAYGADAIKGSIEMVTAIFPDKPVSPGDEWKIKTKLESGMSADMNSTYRFMEKNDDYILINGDSKIETANKDAYIQTNGMDMRYDLTGKMISEIKVDIHTGWIIRAGIHQEIEGDAYIKENAQLPEGLKIPMILKNEMVISSI